MAPALGIGTSGGATSAKMKRKIAKKYLVQFLYMVNGSFNRCRPSPAKHNATSLHQRVTSRQLARLTVTLTMPQLVVQMCKLFIPSLQSELGYSSCQVALGGGAMSWVGIVLAIVPLLMWIVLSVYTGDLPLLKVYAQSAFRSTLLVCVVTAIAVPALIFSDSTETIAYLQSCIVMSFTCGTCWFVVVQKLISVLRNERKNDRMTMLRVDKREVHAGNDSDENEKATNVALKIGKVYEEFGMIDRCMKMYNESIEKYTFEPRKPGMDLIGGYTVTEIDSFSHIDLECVMKLFVAKGKVYGTHQCATKENDRPRPEKVYVDALDIYEHCPSAAILEDHSCVFPIFSGLFLQIKAGTIKIDERSLVDKFVKVTKMNGDPIHYMRALAMKSEVNARLGHFDTSLFAFSLLETMYDAASHHEGLCKSYGSDRAAQAFSAAIFWNRHQGNDKEVKRLQESVVKELLPKQDHKNVHNTFMLLLPVIKTMKDNREFAEAKHLFDDYISKMFLLYIGDDGTTPCLSMFKPIMYLLDAHIYGADMPDLDQVLEWMVTEDNGVSTVFLDGLITSLGWSTFCLTAECCLELSKIAHATDQVEYEEKLKQKGLKLAREAFDKIVNKESGKIMFPIAFDDVEYILMTLDNEYEPVARDVCCLV